MRRILVIEDNDAVREEIALILGFENYDVVLAENGRVGLERVREAQPDLILCDLMMPELDGYETLARLRQDPRGATIPFVCLTARAERVDMRRAMELGADDYVTKPFTASELVTVVKGGLEKRERAKRETAGRVEEVRERHSDRIRKLYELATDATASSGAQVEAAIRHGCQWLGMDIGAVSRVEGDTLVVEENHCVGGRPLRGHRLQLGMTYSGFTWAAQDLVTFHCVTDSPYANHPARQVVGMEAYIGIPLAVDGQPFGVLDFAAIAPKDAPLGPDDRDVVRLLAHWAEAVITRRQAADQLSEAHARAMEASRLKSEFLANVSHEIRTPMTGIIGMTDLLLDMEMTPQQRGFLTVIKSSAHDLLGLLNDLLDFSKIEAGRLVLETVSFELRQHLNDAIKLLAIRAHQKGLELMCHISPEVPETVLGDPLRLRQVIINLAGNAIKFTDQGEIVISVVAERSTAEEVVLHVTVKDTGIGISPDQQARIFQAFTQADGSLTRRYEGTGLGLTISAQLVELMGGQIWVESEVGCGSTFHGTVRLGIDRDGAAATADAHAKGLQGRRILVVDDKEVNRRMLVEMLQRWEIAAEAVADGVEALAALERAADDGVPFDAAILDARMPEMDGFALAGRIRDIPRLASMVLVMLSSAGHPPSPQLDRDLGLAASLTKPIIVPGDLLRSLGAAFQEPSADTDVARPDASASGTVPSLRSLRVLVADDNVANNTVVAYLLEKRGHSVVTVSNGREAVEALAASHFDFVLMDMQMPEMDGFDATRAIRRAECTTGTRIPIIALTAHALAGDRKRCLEAGVDDYLSKPIVSRELSAAIERVMSCTRQADAAAQGAVVSSLSEVGDDSERLLNVVTHLQRDSRTLLSEIRRGVFARDAKAVENAAHRLKGSLKHLRVETGRAAHDAAGALEALGRTGDLDGATEALAALEEEMGRLEPQLASLMTNAAGSGNT